MSTNDEHPLVDKVFDKLEIGGRLGVEILLRGAKTTKRALERSVGLLEGVGSYAERRLEELDTGSEEPRQGKKKRPPPPPPAHQPEPGEDGVLRDPTFNCLDRPGKE